MTNIPFIKMHGLGNDFVIVDTRTHKYTFTPEMIEQIANRHEGVGCDQFVLLESSSNAACFVRFYNADGSQSGACGNASRCVAWLVMQEAGCDEVLLETSSGILSCRKTDDLLVAVNMGKAKTKWHEIPLSKDVDTLNLGIEAGCLKNPVAVSMGNPHAVFFVDEVENVALSEFGPTLEHHAMFPERANIGVAEIVSDSEIILRVWERGAGETQACGTGACAAAVAAFRRKLTGNNVLVHLPGGDLHIEIQAENVVIMTGPVAVCFTGEINAGIFK
jgi:diaminopimelate epimerase